MSTTVGAPPGVIASGYRALPPIPMTGLQGWWDASDASSFTYVSGVVVQQWKDKSGSGHHLDQSTSRPSRNGTINGKSAVSYDGNNNFLASAPFTMPQPFTAFEVCNWDGYPGIGAPIGAVDNSFGMNTQGGNTVRVFAPNAVDTDTGAYSGLHMWGYEFNGASSAVIRDGVRTAILNPGTNGTTSGVRVGSAAHWARVGEVILYDRILTWTERQQVEKYLQAKWATPVPPSPIPTTGLQAWYDASDDASISYGVAPAISQWKDKSGNNAHASQANAAKQPTRGTVLINGMPAISFDGTDDFVAKTGPVRIVNATTGEWTVFAVARSDNLSGGRSVLDLDSDGLGQRYAQLMRTTGTAFESAAANTSSGWAIDPAGVTLTIGTVRCLSAVRQPASVEAWVGGVSNGPTVTSGTAPTGDGATFTIGAWNGGYASFFDGDIAEVIAYSRALSTTERQQVEAYLKSKWGTL